MYMYECIFAGIGSAVVYYGWVLLLGDEGGSVNDAFFLKS